MQEFTNTPSHTHFATRILKKMIRFVPILQIINWRRFNWNVLTDSGAFRFGGILTWGCFRRTHRLKAEPEIRRCGEFDFIISEFNKKPRISELASLGIWMPAQRRRISIRHFIIFKSKLTGEYPWKIITKVDHHR